MLIRMWDVQVEKQDLSKAGMPSRVWLPPFLLHPNTIPAHAVLVQATLISHRCYLLGSTAAGWLEPELRGCCLGWLWVSGLELP